MSGSTTWIQHGAVLACYKKTTRTGSAAPTVCTVLFRVLFHHHHFCDYSRPTAPGSRLFRRAPYIYDHCCCSTLSCVLRPSSQLTRPSTQASNSTLDRDVKGKSGRFLPGARKKGVLTSGALTPEAISRNLQTIGAPPSVRHARKSGPPSR